MYIVLSIQLTIMVKNEYVYKVRNKNINITTYDASSSLAENEKFKKKIKN